MTDFCALTFEDLQLWLEQNGGKSFQANQLFDWVYGKSILRWDMMTNLSHSLRAQLAEHFHLPTLELVKVTPSSDLETYKFLWKLSEGNFVESVLICSGKRRTV